MNTLHSKLLASVANMGDIFTDAEECAALVARAENLQQLARLLGAGGGAICHGSLIADGVVVDANVQALADGGLNVTIPNGFDTSGRQWEFLPHIKNGTAHVVDIFTGDAGDDDTFVVREGEALYSEIILSSNYNLEQALHNASSAIENCLEQMSQAEGLGISDDDQEWADTKQQADDSLDELAALMTMAAADEDIPAAPAP